MDEKEKVEKQRLYSLASDPSSIYAELSITNYTPEIIVAINKFGEKVEMPPAITRVNCQSLFAHHLLIINRGATEWNGTNNRTTIKDNDLIKNMNGEVRRIMLSEVLDHPVYVKSVDMLFCIKADADTAVHPNLANTMHEAVQRLMDQNATRYLNKSLHVSAYAECNDKAFIEEHPNVYVFILGKLSKIPIEYNTRAEVGIVEFTIYEGKVKTATLREALASIEAKGLRELRGCDIVFGLDENAAYAEAQKVFNDKSVKDMLQEQDEILTTVKAQFKADMDAAIFEAETKAKNIKMDADTKITTLNSTIADLKDTISRKDREIESLKSVNGLLSSSVEFNDKQQSRDLNRLRELEQTRRVQTATKAEEIKYDGVVWKIIGGIAVAAVTWGLTVMAKKK